MDVGDVLRSAGAMVGVAAGRAVLRPAEIGQDILIGPAAIAKLRPGVEVPVLAANVQVAVDRTRSAEDASARKEDCATVDTGWRSLPPASSRSTRILGSALSRFARTQPAVPAPTIT